MNKIILFILRGIYKTTYPYKEMPDTSSKTIVYLHFALYLIVVITAIFLIISILTGLVK